MTRTSKRPEPIRRSPFLGAIAAAALIGVPVSIIVTEWLIDSPFVWGIVLLGSAVVGAVFGDSFFDSVADSRWWAVVRGYFRHWWI